MTLSMLTMAITEEEEDENDENEDDEKSAIAIVDLLVLNARQPAQRDGWGHCIGASKIKDTQTRTLTRYRPLPPFKYDRKLCLFFLCLSFSLVFTSFRLFFHHFVPFHRIAHSKT